MKRVVSVWLPDWPVTVWSKAPAHPKPPDGAPFALTHRGVNGLSLHALNAPARALGLRRGQAHADACAIAPRLLSAPAEPERDLAHLRRLALWAERFSPCVAADADAPGWEGLLLDMTGGAHLFGGEAALLGELHERLAKADIPARAAIADTPGAAWALARFAADKDAIATPGGTREALAGLPLEALRLEGEALRLLARFGLKRIGDLYDLPRAGLARRFRGEAGLRVVERLDQALGAASEPLRPERPAPAYRAWRVFAEPITVTEGVGFHLPGLAEALAAQLDRDGQGARRLTLTAFRVDGRTTAIEASLSTPSLAVPHWLRLLRETGLERLDLGFGADALMLAAPVAEPMVARQREMGQAGEAAPEALAGLIDRLQAKLGEGAARRPVLCESWVPERGERWVPAGGAAEADAPAIDRRRPILLLDPPEPVETLAELPDGVPARFVWRRAAHRVVKAQGPERLSPEWWRTAALPEERRPRTRDYYRVEDEHGRRFWLFREGLYGREDADKPPSWRLHGVFA